MYVMILYLTLRIHEKFLLYTGANPFLTTYTGENAICMALYFFLNHPNNNDFTCLDILCETGL